MELLTINLAANQTQQFAKSARQIEIIDSTYAVRIDFTASQGQQSDSMVGAVSGLFLRSPFAGFAVTNGPVAQTVTLLLIENGDGGSRRQPGNVRVIDEVTASVQTLGPALAAAIANNVATVVLAPGANVAGCVIRSASIGVQAGAGGTVNLRLIASPIAPGGSLGAFFTIVATASNGTNYTEASLWDLKKRIPPGWGVYAFHSITGAIAAVNGVIMSCELQ